MKSTVEQRAVEQKMDDLAALGEALALDCELLWQGPAVAGATAGFEAADLSEFVSIEDDLTRSHQSITAFLVIEAWLIGTELPDWSAGKVSFTASSTEAQSTLTPTRVTELTHSRRAVSHRSTSQISKSVEKTAKSEAKINPTISDVSPKQNFPEVATAIGSRLLTSQTSSIETRPLASTQPLVTQTSIAQTAIETRMTASQKGLQAFSEAITKTEKGPSDQPVKEDPSLSQSLHLPPDSLLENDISLPEQQARNQPIRGLSALAQIIQEQQQIAAQQIVDPQPTVQKDNVLSERDRTSPQAAASLLDKIEPFNGLSMQSPQQQSSSNVFSPITPSTNPSTQSELAVEPVDRLSFPAFNASNNEPAVISPNIEEITAAIADPLYEKITAEVAQEYRRFYGDG